MRVRFGNKIVCMLDQLLLVVMDFMPPAILASGYNDSISACPISLSKTAMCSWFNYLISHRQQCLISLHIGNA